MARKLIVGIFADYRAFVAGIEKAGVATEQFAAEVNISSQKIVDSQIKASVATQKRLREQIVLYKEVGAAAETGSAEQIAATRLAAEAQNRLQRELGETAVAAERSGAAQAAFGRDLRGGLSGAGLFSGVTRSLAFASGGFLAFEGITRTISDSIRVAQEAKVSQAALAAQMKANNEDFDRSARAIDEAEKSMAQFGFTTEDSAAALTILDRATRNIQQAIALQGLAADLARAKQITLAQAALVVGKVFGGQETALRRAVPGLSRTAHGMDLVRLAEARLAGQAEANTTQAQKFAAELHETERTLGTALLPSMNKVLAAGAKLLEEFNKSPGVLRAMGDAAKIAAGGFDILAKGIGGALSIWRKFQDLRGKAGIVGRVIGIAAAPELEALKLEAKAVGAVDKALGGASDSADKFKLSLQQLNAAQDAETGALNALDTAARSVFGFLGKPLPPVTALANQPSDREAGRRQGGVNITNALRNQFFDRRISRQLDLVQDIPSLQGQINELGRIQALVEAQAKKVKDVTRQQNLLDQARAIHRVIVADQAQQADNAKQAADAAKAKQQAADAATLAWLQVGVDRAALTPTLTDDIAKELKLIAGIRRLIRLRGRTSDLVSQLTAARGNLQQLRQAQAQQAQQAKADVLQLKIQQAQLTPTLRDDIKRQEDYIAYLKGRIAVTKDATALQSELVGHEQTLAQLQKQRADNVKKAALAARQRPQYRALGLTATGEERLPKVAVLLERIRKLQKAIRGTDQDTKANRTFLTGAIADLLGKHGTVTTETVSKINDFWSTVRGALDKGAKQTLPYFKHLSAQAIVDSLGGGLTAAQRRRLELQLTGIGPGLTVPGGRSTAYAAGIRPGVVIHEAHFHGVQNLSQLEDEMEKRQRARAYRRRGAR